MDTYNNNNLNTTMTDEQLAKILFYSNILSKEQIDSGKSLKIILMENGLINPDEVKPGQSLAEVLQKKGIVDLTQ